METIRYFLTKDNTISLKVFQEFTKLVEESLKTIPNINYKKSCVQCAHIHVILASKDLVDKIFPNVVSENALLIAPLTALPTALRRRVIREWLKQNRGDLRRIGFVHILSIESLALEGEGNRYVELPDGWKVLRSGKYLKLE